MILLAVSRWFKGITQLKMGIEIKIKYIPNYIQPWSKRI